MAIATEDLLTLLQWLSPSYPVGAFSYSHGLEQAIETGQVRDAASLQGWIADVLEHGAGASDAILLVAAHADPAAADRFDATARALASSAERLKETDLQGAAFCNITRAVWDLPLAGLTYPVAVGTAAGLRGLAPDAVAAAYLHAFASTLASVGMRLVPLGQTDGQRIIRALAPLCQHIAADSLHGDPDRIGTSTFLADIAAMRHETQYSRIFRT
ncbi:MAG: urease accessory protein UreF [Marinibacterium sp.]|nr:urease accessory protein UreF [Marinibacterium sp.]